MFWPGRSRRRRVFNAALVLVGNLIAWVLLPYYLGVYAAGYGTNTPLTTPAFVYEFGLLITVLQVGAALSEGRFLWVPFATGTSLVVAYYLWTITGGGVLTVATSGISLTLEFRNLLYLLLIPTFWAALRAPLSYILYRRAERSASMEAAPRP